MPPVGIYSWNLKGQVRKNEIFSKYFPHSKSLSTFPAKAKSYSLPEIVRILPFPLLLRNRVHCMLSIKHQKKIAIKLISPENPDLISILINLYHYKISSQGRKVGTRTLTPLRSSFKGLRKPRRCGAIVKLNFIWQIKPPNFRRQHFSC